MEYIPAKDGQPEVSGGIGEEDIVYLVLPYIHTAREGVLRLGKLLEKYGTYEMNGIAFQDVHEIWWLETIGGHHWIAKRVPDDAYVVMPNQLGSDQFDLEDALGAKKNHLCSADLDNFIENNHLDLSWNGVLNPRDAFGSHDDSDHVYNTPRAWFMLRYLNPHSKKWDGAVMTGRGAWYRKRRSRRRMSNTYYPPTIRAHCMTRMAAASRTRRAHSAPSASTATTLWP